MLPVSCSPAGSALFDICELGARARFQLHAALVHLNTVQDPAGSAEGFRAGLSGLFHQDEAALGPCPPDIALRPPGRAPQPKEASTLEGGSCLPAFGEVGTSRWHSGSLLRAESCDLPPKSFCRVCPQRPAPPRPGAAQRAWEQAGCQQDPSCHLVDMTGRERLIEGSCDQHGQPTLALRKRHFPEASLSQGLWSVFHHKEHFVASWIVFSLRDLSVCRC